MPLEIIRYNDILQCEWDTFVKESKNGTFLFERNYMDYHKDRFTDFSLMIYNDQKLCALFPATINTEKKAIVSHGGLTYGGLVTGKSITAELVLEIFADIKSYYLKNSDAKSIIYRPVPHIYHSYPAEEDLYALFRNDARLIERKISSTINLHNPLPFKGRRGLTSAMKNRLKIAEDYNFAPFWDILTERLGDKYGVAPVHTLKEIELLNSKFPNNIRLFRVINENDTTLGGVVIYIMNRVAHVQYIGASEEGRRIGIMDFLYEYLIKEKYTNLDYFDFGISVEEGGHYLNSGLIAHKERFGGRATMYDAYQIDLQ